jgi:hypothetical protein
MHLREGVPGKPLTFQQEDQEIRNPHDQQLLNREQHQELV